MVIIIVVRAGRGRLMCQQRTLERTGTGASLTGVTVMNTTPESEPTLPSLMV